MFLAVPSLCRKYHRATRSLVTQNLNFLSLSRGIDEDTQKEWTRQVTDWEKDLSQPDPYYVERRGTSITLCYISVAH